MKAWLLIAVTLFSTYAMADDIATYRLEMKDGHFIPPQLQVPAHKKFRLAVINTGKTPVEFESTTLRKEKVLAPGAQSSLIILPLDPGKYEFFDDFHPSSRSIIIAK